jgi:hypothetical protein
MHTASRILKVKEAQAALQVVYEQKLPALSAALSKLQDQALSNPQLLDIASHGYSAASVRLLIVGQQTQSWFGEWKDTKGKPPAEAVRELLKRYHEFDLGEEIRGTPFWHCSHKLYRLLNPTGPENGFLYSNLIKMDGWNEKKRQWGYPGWQTEELLNNWFDVLVSEVKLAEPDVVVFFTGHRYDECIQRIFLGAQFSTTAPPGFGPNWLSIVKHDKLPQHSYRTYHPGYLNRQGRHRRDAILEAIRSLVSG